MLENNKPIEISLKKLNKDNTSQKYEQWLNNKETNKFLESRFKALNKDDLKNYIEICNNNENIILRGIFIQNKHIGNIKLDINHNHHYAYLGILIGDTKFLKQGIGKDAINKIFEIAKEQNINKILAGIYANNIASINLFKSLDFKQSGLLKNHYLFKKEYIDKIIVEKMI